MTRGWGKFDPPMASNLTQYSAGELRTKLANAQARMRSLRASSGSTMERGVELAFGVGGMAASGYIQAKNAEVMGVRADGLIGGAGILAGLLGFGGKYSDELLTFGLTCAAPYVSELVKDQVGS